jgi:2-haloacid dehalogenase
MTDHSNIKALTWDIGGTVFDWRGTIQDEVRRLFAEQEANADVQQFATDWRVWSFDMLGRVNRGEIPWTNLDSIHRQVLDDVLAKHSEITFSTAQRDDLADVWHRLRAWSSAADAIRRLRSRYTMIVLTVLSYAIAVDCSKRNGIDWDGILSCEFLGHYKGPPNAYNAAVRLLRIQPSEAMMVAAHAGDLHNAKGIGMSTAYVHREGESNVMPGYSDVASMTADPKIDVVATDFPDLANKLLA